MIANFNANGVTYEQNEILYPDFNVTVGTSLPPPGLATPPYTVYNLNQGLRTCPEVAPDYFVCKFNS
jgi:hypothetical protein